MTYSAVADCRRTRSLARSAAAVALLYCLPSASPALAQDRSITLASAVNAADAATAPKQIDDVGVTRTGAAAAATAPRSDPCGGVDLVQALKMSDPAGFAQFEDTARTVANGQGLLWRVESMTGKVSYLFGTMHSSEPAAKTFDDLVMRALGRSRVVATELPGASSRRVASELRRLVAARSFRPAGDSLAGIASDIRPAVEMRISQAGIPPAVADQLQPWYLALSLSRSNCAEPVVGSDTETADARIERLAVEKGATLLALETPVEQVDALASIPDDVALRMLKETTVKRLKPEDVESTITGLYSTRRIGYLLAMRGPAWASVFDVDGYADFISSFITRRNATMLQRALPILNGGNAFLAVGALHLPGERGLVELIRAQGYSVTRIW
ncbi:MAG: TraB/GumN family protein [Hansschlegelia sp.]